jgi:hypothetical protein
VIAKALRVGTVLAVAMTSRQRASTLIALSDDSLSAAEPDGDCLDTAVVFGLPAAAEVLKGWRQVTGREADAMAYWDLVAGLTTPPDMRQWLPVAHAHGRVDLDAGTLNNRRDAFVRAALEQLEQLDRR